MCPPKWENHRVERHGDEEGKKKKHIRIYWNAFACKVRANGALIYLETSSRSTNSIIFSPKITPKLVSISFFEVCVCARARCVFVCVVNALLKMLNWYQIIFYCCCFYYVVLFLTNFGLNWKHKHTNDAERTKHTKCEEKNIFYHLR